jgi:hypothetical protein
VSITLFPYLLVAFCFFCFVGIHLIYLAAVRLKWRKRTNLVHLSYFGDLRALRGVYHSSLYAANCTFQEDHLVIAKMYLCMCRILTNATCSFYFYVLQELCKCDVYKRVQDCNNSKVLFDLKIYFHVSESHHLMC